MIFQKNYKEYLKHGMVAIPVLGKAPGIRGWTELTLERVKNELAEGWLKNGYLKNANLGVLAGKASGIVGLDNDLDLNNPIHREIYDEIADCLPETSGITKIGKKGYTDFFKYSGERSESFSIQYKGQQINVLDILSDSRQVVLPPSIHPDTQKPYVWKNKSLLEVDPASLPILPSNFMDTLSSKLAKLSTNTEEPVTGSDEGRNNYLKRVAANKLKSGENLFKVAHDLFVLDQLRHKPPLYSDTTEYLRTSSLPRLNALKFASGIQKTVDPEGLSENPWGEGKLLTIKKNFPKLSEEAFYGPAGEFVKLTFPHTESSKAALLLQFLTVIGNVVGRNRYIQVEATRHYPVLYLVLVGDTAKARKGTSLNHVLRLVKMLDSKWSKSCVKSGLSSGEGLLMAVSKTDEKDEVTSDAQF